MNRWPATWFKQCNNCWRAAAWVSGGGEQWWTWGSVCGMLFWPERFSVSGSGLQIKLIFLFALHPWSKATSQRELFSSDGLLLHPPSSHVLLLQFVVVLNTSGGWIVWGGWQGGSRLCSFFVCLLLTASHSDHISSQDLYKDFIMYNRFIQNSKSLVDNIFLLVYSFVIHLTNFVYLQHTCWPSCFKYILKVEWEVSNVISLSQVFRSAPNWLFPPSRSAASIVD